MTDWNKVYLGTIADRKEKIKVLEQAISLLREFEDFTGIVYNLEKEIKFAKADIDDCFFQMETTQELKEEGLLN